MKLLWERHLRPADTGVTTAPSAPAQDLQHPWVLCTSLSTRTKCTSSAVAHRQHHQPTTTTASPKRVSRCGASKEGTTPIASPSHVHKWTEFSPQRSPCSRTRYITMVPLAGRTTPQECRHHRHRQDRQWRHSPDSAPCLSHTLGLGSRSPLLSTTTPQLE